MSKQFTIREATSADIPALADLHVRTWNETYFPARGPGADVREYQWRQSFATDNGSWFVYVVETEKGELIGFARGMRYDHEDLPQFSGELNKIYLLREYHGRGLGVRLLGYVVRRFLSMGIDSMVLFGEATNPTCGFHEHMGGARLAPNLGNYGWADLTALAARCPPE